MFHVAWYQWGKPAPADDIDRAEWFALEKLDEVIIPEHKPLVELLRTYIKNINPTELKEYT